MRPANILLATVLFAALGIGAVSALNWQIETVDASAGPPGGWPSLALDGAGASHISYGGGCLKYAAYNGSGWEIQTVDPAVTVGRGTSLAIDAAGNPRIAYHDSTNQDLRYAAWDGSAWRIETVESAGSVGAYPSLALDGAGNPRISYIDSTNRMVRYAACDGATWQTETVASMRYDGRSSSLALDSAGVPHIAYLESSRMNYTEFGGTGWRNEIIGSADYPSLALDRAGNPHLAHIAPSSTALVYRAHDGSGWQTAWVDWNGVVEYNYWYLIPKASLALDAGGNPRISYHHQNTNALRYAAYNASSWQWDLETVDGATDAFSSSSLALDGAGNPRIAYYGNGNLKFARADLPRPVIVAVPGGVGLPTGVGAAWIRDDVNGNGRRDFADVVLYFNEIIWIAANEPLVAFDYSGDGRIGFPDVVWLFVHLDAAPLRTFAVRGAALGPGTIQPSGNLTVREGENVTFTLRIGPDVVTPSGTGSGWSIGNYVVVDPTVAPTPFPEPKETYGPYPAPYNYTRSYTLPDVQANHTVYGVFYKAGYIVC